ncbi:MAG: hypothetical protein EOO17_01040, partial [Chloroflexi bacterium]
MAKTKKKRTKVYSGSNAAIKKPSVMRISAVNRGKAGQWWFDHKRLAKPALITSAVVLVIIICVSEVIRLT